MRRKIVFVSILVILIFISGCERKYKNEWIEKDGVWFYYDDLGKKVKNTIKEIDGDKYHFDSKGNMEIKVLVKEGDKKYYFGEDGKLSKSGWITFDGKYYYIDVDGSVRTGWQKDDSVWYYMDEDGIMQKDTWVGDNKEFYVDREGKMLVNVEKEIDSQYYYFDTTGKAIKIKHIWKKYYYTNEFGENTNIVYIGNTFNKLFTGNFSNSATTNSKCKFEFLIDKRNVDLMMYEYEIYQVKGVESYSCSIRLDDGYTINFAGHMNGDRISFDNVGRKAVVNYLNDNKAFKLYLKQRLRYGTPSTYLVEVEPDNFKYVWSNYNLN